ncbi:SNF2 helicase associated domain-containing protein [Clostridiaceae bacterium M8S5]|nr:SNF2 helicase associated domain-containing protein [Clostridiaceae bacterium M8S5]
MFNIEINEILSNASSSATFKRGVNYFKSNKVKNVKHDQINNIVTAVIKGSYDYNVEVYIGDNGSPMDCSCDCQAFQKYGGLCKHIVATLLFLLEISNVETATKKHKEDGIDNLLLDYFVDQAEDIRKYVNIEYNLIIENPKFSKIWLRIGYDKLYIVKNMKKFIESIIYSESLVLGKKFTYNDESCRFNQKDQEILNYINDLYVHNEEISNMNWNTRSMFFSGKYLILNNSYLKLFLSYFNNDVILNTQIIGKNLKKVKIINDDLPLRFNLNKKLKTTNLSLESIDNIMPIMMDGSYFYLDNNIYKISSNQKRHFMPIYNMIMLTEEKNIAIKNNILEKLLSHICPIIKEIGSLNIDKSLSDEIYEHDLQSEIYLDKERNLITAKVKNKYGEYEIDPLKEEKTKANKIILRDIRKEYQIQEFLSNYNFKVSTEGYFLDGEDYIFEFLSNGLNELKDKAIVYYSDKFKQIATIKKKILSTSVLYNNGDDYLTFNFTIDGIEDLNFADILKAYNEKKKFYRLSDGSLLSLENNKLDKFVDLVDYVGLEEDDIKSGSAQLPKFKAFYLNEQLKEIDTKYNRKNIDFKQLIMRIKEPSDENYDLPAEVKGVLRDYQEVGYSWLRLLSELGFGGILADDMGLGKTLQVLSYLKAKHEQKKGISLIVVPTSLIYNWLNEAQKFVPSLKIIVVNGHKEDRVAILNNLENVEIIITSYTMIRNDIEIYKEINFSVCILDEAQHIKNYNSKTSKAIKKLKTKDRFALTGTPIENTLLELWSVFDFLMPGYLLSINKFRELYEKPILKSQEEKALISLKKHIAPFILRRVKKDVLDDLPEKIENKIVVELTNAQKKLYIAYLNKYKEEINNLIKTDGYAKSHIKVLAALTRMRQICCHPNLFLENYNETSSKLDLVLELIDELIEGKHRTLIFSQFTSMLRIIEEKLVEKKISYYYLDGSIKSKNRNEMVTKFNEGHKEVFLISLKAGGTGLNLTGADTVIHFDPWWNPAVEMQAEDRAYRIGQDKVVHVMKLITKGTIEEKIYELQQKKKIMIDSIIQPGQTFITKLQEKDIRELFET